LTLKKVYQLLSVLSIAVWLTLVFIPSGYAYPTGAPRTIRDTLPPGPGDSLRFPIYDRRGDKFTQPEKNSFNLKDPRNIKDSIVYDPKTKQYYIIEKIGTKYYRKPTYLTFDEFVRLQAQKEEEDYFKTRANTVSLLNQRLQKPKLNATNDLFNRLFGTGKVDIRPSGNVDVTMGYQGQNIKNPTLPERARKNGGLDFDLSANLNVIGNVGDKLKLPISYNTTANFDYENQLKLDYTGYDDEIIKKIEIGNTSFASKGTLIPGAQALFGVKTQLQFGKLWVTTIFANQRSQRQSLSLQGGAATNPIYFKADDYDENRNFLLAQYFRNNYNTVMKNLPVVSSQVQILRIELWVTTRTGDTRDRRDVVALMDLGENKPFGNYPPLIVNPLPSNNSNGLYAKIVGDPSSRNPALVVNELQSLGLTPVQDFEKTFAKKLDSTQYEFNPQAGFIRLAAPLQQDEVLGVAFQYVFNGKVFQVGEFSQDVPIDSTSGISKILFLKMLKATSPRTKLPIWDLMMKNIYTLKAENGNYLGSLDRDNFQLNILYQEAGSGEKRYLPEGSSAGIPLLTLLNLDRLNNQLDPQPDGVFDYLEGFTVVSNRAQIIFPVLEPFGHDLDTAFSGGSVPLREKYLFYPLYDTIKAIAQTYANLDRFVFKGSAKSTGVQSEISLNAFNIPQGSVTVMAGGQTLIENQDYVIDYNLGTVRILNQAILTSGIPVNVQFENNATYGVQQKNYLGLRLDYLASKKFSIGGTLVRLTERPFFTKMGYGEDPVRNTMMGGDFSYRSDIPRLNRWLSHLPNFTPQSASSINAYGEAAVMKPGHPPQIGKGSAGLIYIDDFEGTRSSIDLRFPLVNWALASTPKGDGLFPEADLFNDLNYGKNRAKIAWYNIEPIMQEKNNGNNPLRNNLDELSDPRVRAVSQAEIFPQRTPDFGLNQLVTFDLSFYPRDRGPYNYDDVNVDNNGHLTNPKSRWGGLMRSIDQTDFETGNVEFIEFWVLDPFIKNTNPAGGQLYFNLGNVSEDILKDSRRFYENGLPTPTIPATKDSSRWGVVPLNPIQVTTSFSNDPNDRPYQDVGLDGLNDDTERIKRSVYLQDLANLFGTGSIAYQGAFADPSTDNFRYYRDGYYDQNNTGILGRYKQFNNPQGNSPIASTNSQFSSAATLYPDAEDLNRDNTLNEVEEYFEYKVDVKPSTDPNMQVGQNFIVDKKFVNVALANGNREEQVWYQFRIPISEYAQKVGNIPDFKSIRFVRMFMTGFEDSTVLRFAELELIRNQWRRFTYKLDTSGIYTPINVNGGTTFNVGAVNIEENDKRDPIPYRIPPGIERVQSLSNGGINILQNEQALSMQICNLLPGDARGVFKTLNLDLRRYRKLSMFVHAESVKGNTPINNGDLYAVIRLGSDYLSNYYEIKFPLSITPFGTTLDTAIWPTANNLDFDLGILTNLKNQRNLSINNPNQIYRQVIDGRTYSVFGSPNLGEIRGVFVGVENGIDASVCTEVWINELRLSNIDEKGGWAALGRVDLALSDLGNISISVNTHTTGFGSLEQKINERYMDDFMQFDATTNLQLGKLLPKRWGIEIPFYGSYSRTTSLPEFDPYDKDILLKTKLKAASGSKKDSIRNDAIDELTIKTLNFTNVRKAATNGKRIRLWSVSNFDVSYSFTQTTHHNPLIESNEITRHRAGLGYNYTGQPKYWEPFKKLIKTKTHWLDLIKDFNLNPVPALIGVRFDVNRQFGAYRPRNVGGGKYLIPETYDKYFTFDRIYNLRWDVTKSFNVDFKATNNSRIDEPPGRIDTKQKKDSVWSNFWKGGRNVLYTQNADFTYNFPTSKLPIIDWTTVSLIYRTNYSWIGASRLAIELGNTIQNGYQKGATIDLDFNRLYNKSKWLRALDQPQGGDATNQQPPPPNAPKKDSGANRNNRDPNAVPEINGALRVVGKLLTSIKRMGLTYTENASSFIPGYTDSTKFLGQNWNSMAPGLDFVFGRQPDSSWLNDAAKKGLITKTPFLNNLIQQTYDQSIRVSAQLEPARDLIIDLNLDKSLTKTYSELFKDTIGTGSFGHLSPYAGGGFSITYISFQTLFAKFDPNQISEAFQRFEANRIVLSERLGKQNPYSTVKDPDGYYKGYGRYSQDVLIPSFIAAYTKQDPTKVKLLGQGGAYVQSNPFNSFIPLPNWRLTYNGLTRIKGVEKVFTNFTITHGYTSRLSMNSFNSALLFQDSMLLGYPSFVDTISHNFIPYFLMPNLTITESFEPLFGIDFSLVNQISGKFEYAKSRTLSLSLIDYQLSEVRSQVVTVGASWRKRGFPLPVKIKLSKKGPSKKLENDITFRLDFSIRDDANSNSRLDQSNAFATGGQKVITIQPSIDYVLSNRVNIKLYFDQRRVNPYISSSAPMVNTRAGVQLRISLAQ